jgi:hypothetical protein
MGLGTLALPALFLSFKVYTLNWGFIFSKSMYPDGAFSVTSILGDAFISLVKDLRLEALSILVEFIPTVL